MKLSQQGVGVERGAACDSGRRSNGIGRTVLNARLGILAVFALVGACTRPATPVSCGAIDLVDQAALVARPPVLNSDPPGTVRLSDVARAWAAQPQSLPIAGETAAATAEIHSRQSFHMDPREQTYRAIRMAGTWRVATATISHDEAETTVRQPDRILSAAAGRELDAILTGPCLWRAPRTLGAWVPVRDRRLELFDSGVQSLLDIRAGGRRWTGFYSNVNLGPAGQIANLLRGEAPGPAHDDAELIRRANIP